MKSLNLVKPHMIIVVGIPGSGKSFFGQQFSDTFNAPYIQFDDLDEFTSDEKTKVSLWDYLLNQLAKTKQTILVEGIGSSRTERRALSTFARSHGFQPLYIWVQTEPQTAQVRATKGVGKQKPSHPLTTREFDEKVAQFEPLLASEHYMVISGKHTYASQAKNVLNKLASPRADKTKTAIPTERAHVDQTLQSPQRRGRITIN